MFNGIEMGKMGGWRPGSGRKPGKVASIKRNFGNRILPDKREEKMWDELLNDPKTKWEAFKLLVTYKHGQPPKAPEDRESESQLNITVRHIGIRDSSSAEAK